MALLERIELSRNSVFTRKAIIDPNYSLHQELTSLFKDKWETGRLLWRLDISSERVVVYFTHSGEEGSVIVFMEKFCSPSCKRETVNLNDYINTLRIEQGITALIRTTPVRRVKGKSYSLSSNQEILDWFTEKGDRLGFRLEKGEILPDNGSSRQNFKTSKQEGTDKFVTIDIVNIKAILKVIDVVNFGKALTVGIGRNRAFGLGLLMIDGIFESGV